MLQFQKQSLKAYRILGANCRSRVLQATIKEILGLPISPELLPPDENGNIAQETESIIGSYNLHDFFLYQLLN